MTLLFFIVIAVIVYYFFINKQAQGTIPFGVSNKRCPNCSNGIEPGFNVCPVCKETLRKQCHRCGKMVDITWKYCPYCEELLRGSSRKRSE